MATRLLHLAIMLFLQHRVPDFIQGIMRRGSIIPIKFARIFSILHGIFGALFLVCCLFMPVTANWIWPRYGTPKEIIYLIASMYIAIVLGMGCIRLYKFLLSHFEDDSKGVQQKKKSTAASNVEQLDIELFDDNVAAKQQRANDENLDEASAPSNLQSKICSYPRLLPLLFKYAHGVLMVYSWVMLLGAGQAFLTNSRLEGFPYPPGPITDSLVGRCYARNLTSQEMPSWLLNLHCGFRVMCADSSL